MIDEVYEELQAASDRAQDALKRELGKLRTGRAHPGMLDGICQASILWRYVNGAWAWVLANVVGGVVVFSLGIATASGAVVAPFSVLVTVLALSAAPCIVTGFAMLWLIHFNWKY
jgi:hypothetical protein